MAVSSKDEEDLIIVGLCQTAECGSPCGTEEVKFMVKSYLDKRGTPNPLQNNVSGKDWIICFKRRWSNQLIMQKPEILTLARRKALSKSTIDFFKLVKSAYEKGGLTCDGINEEIAGRLFNCFNQDYARIQKAKKFSLLRAKKMPSLRPLLAEKQCTQFCSELQQLVNICLP